MSMSQWVLKAFFLINLHSRPEEAQASNRAHFSRSDIPESGRSSRKGSIAPTTVDLRVLP